MSQRTSPEFKKAKMNLEQRLELAIQNNQASTNALIEALAELRRTPQPRKRQFLRANRKENIRERTTLKRK